MISHKSPRRFGDLPDLRPCRLLDTWWGRRRIVWKFIDRDVQGVFEITGSKKKLSHDLVGVWTPNFQEMIGVCIDSFYTTYTVKILCTDKNKIFDEKYIKI